MHIEPPDLDRNVHCLLGLPFDAVSLSAAAAAVRQAAAQRKPLFVSTPNLNFLVACSTDAAFRDSVINSELSLADGMPIIWLAKLLGIPLRERVAGSTLFEALRGAPTHDATAPLRVYFFGGPDGVAEKASAQINAGSSAMRCVGFASPGFVSVQAMSTPATLQHINDSQPDFVVVSLGAKKGQTWIEHNRRQLNAPVISHLGAVVNMVAGTVLRAPVWMQRVGLEWLWRIREEPTLWRRYFNDGLALLRLVLTRAIPLWWFSRFHAPAQDSGSTISASVDAGDNTVHIQLSGSCIAHNLPALRAELKKALGAGCDIALDLAGVTHADSAFWGLLMVVHGYQSRTGRSLHLVATPKTIRRLGHYAGVDLLWSEVK